MSMVTSCPACATTFRVSQDQLKARQGKVRCGKCAEVFDAFKTLASYPDEASPEPSPAPGIDADQLRSVESAPLQTALDIDRAAAVDSALASTAEAREGLAKSPRGFLAGLITLLSITFLLQLLYAMRMPVTHAMPGLRPHFERVCALTGCTITLPKRTDVLAIEYSDLQADPKRPGVIVLTAALRNRGAEPVELPALELTLTNAQDQAVARRIFLPKDYVERPDEAQAGMRAAKEVNVRIELDTGELRAAGYRLFLFYP